jgi:VanZ family protein
MKTNKLIAAILLSLVIAVAAIIFILSSQTGDVSNDVSQGVTDDFLSFVDGDKQPGFSLHRLIRKCAHMAEYAALSFLLCAFIVYVWRSAPFYRTALIAWFIATLYGVSDEIHQLFVPGRSGALKDVLIDSAGAAIGVLALAVFLGIVRIWKKKRLEAKEGAI